MYQSIKDLCEIIERNHSVQLQILQNQTSIIGEHSTTEYTRGFVAGLDHALGLLNVLLDEYETEPQPSNADEAASDALDFVSFMKQCRP